MIGHRKRHVQACMPYRPSHIVPCCHTSLADNAGKTTILYKLSCGEVVVSQTTVGSNVEHVTYKNTQLEVGILMRTMHKHGTWDGVVALLPWHYCSAMGTCSCMGLNCRLLLPSLSFLRFGTWEANRTYGLTGLPTIREQMR